MSTQHIAAQVSALPGERALFAAEILALACAAVAAGFTISSSFVKTMVPLRWFAVMSKCGFFASGCSTPSWVMALMHGCCCRSIASVSPDDAADARVKAATQQRRPVRDLAATRT